LVNIRLEYFETAIDWMRAQPWFDDRLLAVSDASRGGDWRLLLGATFTEINAVAARMPSGVVFWALGLAEPGDARPPVAWTFRGKPLPYLQENNTSGDPPPAPEPGRVRAVLPQPAARCAPSSARPSRSRRSAGRRSWSRASTIRCGRRPARFALPKRSPKPGRLPRR
jgi:BAAT / Acyl-CoA thioester hydrolase C terminal